MPQKVLYTEMLVSSESCSRGLWIHSAGLGEGVSPGRERGAATSLAECAEADRLIAACQRGAPGGGLC